MIQDNNSLRRQSHRMPEDHNMLELPLKKYTGRTSSAASAYSTQQDSTPNSKAGSSSDPFANPFDYSN